MTRNHRRIIALLVRFDNAFDLLEEAAAEQYDMDSLFDGGEFSGPAVRRQVIRDADKLAQRLGFASACLVDRIACQLGVRRVASPFNNHNPWREQ